MPRRTHLHVTHAETAAAALAAGDAAEPRQLKRARPETSKVAGMEDASSAPPARAAGRHGQASPVKVERTAAPATPEKITKAAEQPVTSRCRAADVKQFVERLFVHGHRSGPLALEGVPIAVAPSSGEASGKQQLAEPKGTSSSSCPQVHMSEQRPPAAVQDPGETCGVASQAKKKRRKSKTELDEERRDASPTQASSPTQGSSPTRAEE